MLITLILTHRSLFHQLPLHVKSMMEAGVRRVGSRSGCVFLLSDCAQVTMSNGGHMGALYQPDVVGSLVKIVFPM